MVDAKTTATVGVQMSPEGMLAAANKIGSSIERITNQLNKAAASADAAISKGAKAQDTAAQTLNGQLKALAANLGQVRTLVNSMTAISARGQVNAAGLLGDFGNTRKLGAQVRAMTEYRNALNGVGSSMTVLRNRVIQFDHAAGNLAKRGQELSQGQLFKAERLRDTAQAYSKITNEVGNLRGRIALLSSEGQRAFAPYIKSLDELEKRNANAFANRRRSNFLPEVTETRAAVNSLKQQLATREKLEAKTRLNVEALREEGQQLIRNNQLEARAAAIRTGQRTLSNMALTGDTLRQRDIDLTSRFARATSLAATARNQLTAALNAPDTSAARINTLIARYKALQREIGLTAAQQRALAAQGPADSPRTGGFFGGFKSTATGLLADEGGGAFGAGALVGRVGAYAVAAGAIYGLLASMRETVAFTVRFEDALAQLQAISGSTSVEMSRLSSSILEVSQHSASSVTELTEAATIIAQAGYAGSEIETMLRSVTALSDASGSSASESVDILTSALGSFQLEASESTRITDALVSALNDSKLSVNQVQLGLQYVGATARLNNITFNELVSTLGAMADAGIRSGSTMSTGLRQMLVDFIDPSKKLIEQLEKVGLTTADIDVKTLGLTTVLTRLRDSGFQAYGALETRAAAAYAVLSTNIDQIKTLEEATLRQGAAEEAQEARLDSLSAKWQLLLNTLADTASMITGVVTPVLKVLVSGLTDCIASLNDFLKLFGFVANWALGFRTAINSSSVDIEQFSQRLRDAGVSADDTEKFIERLGGSLEDIETTAKDAEAEMASLETQQASLASETQKLILRKDDLAGKSGEVAHQVNVLSSRFPGLRTEFLKTEGGINGLIAAMIRMEEQAAKTLATQARFTRESQRLIIDQSREEATGAIRGFAGFMRRSSDWKDPKEQRQAEEMLRFVLEGKFDEAIDVYGSIPNGAFRTGIGKYMGPITRLRAEARTARLKYDNAQSTIDTANFLGSDTGRELSGVIRTSGPMSERAASQGSFEGRSASTIEAELKDKQIYLAQLEKENSGNLAALGVIGQAQASVNAALARLAPEPADAKSGSSGANRAAREAERRQKELARIDADIQKEEVEYRKELYQNRLRELDDLTSLDQIPDIVADIDDSLTDWLAGEAELAIQDIEKNNPTSEQRTKMLETATRKAEQLRIENVEKVADALSAAIREFITRTTDAIERQFDQSMRFTERNLALSQGRLSGLSNSARNQDVPDYMQTIAQRDVDLAQDRVNMASIGANQSRINQYQSLIARARAEKAVLNRELEALGRAENSGTASENEIVVARRKIGQAKERMKELDDQLIKLEDSTYDLSLANEALRASYAVLESAPRSFGAGLEMAIQAVAIEIDAASSFSQEIINGIDGPLRAVHQGFQSFFTDIMSGTVSAGQAFKSFAGSVIDSLIQMAAVAAANQIFSMIAGAFGPGGPTNLLAGTPYGWKGGEIGSLPVRHMYGGGSVAGGLGTRDSTLVHAANEEYLIRRPAAVSIGKKYLDQINARGVDALRDLAKPIPIPMGGGSGSPVNVYVVAPEERPTMGPNDVLATFSNDVLKGGVTKKLIKQVASGG